MKPYRDLALVALMFGVLLGWCAGAEYPASAQGYGGGGMGASALSFDPQQLTVRQGGSASAKVTVKLVSGKTWATTLGVTDAPPGVTVGFDPATGDPTFTSTMHVKADSAAKPGAYKVKIQATGDDPSAVVQYQVTVTKSSYGY